mgnify:CR=1 FL=1
MPNSDKSKASKEVVSLETNSAVWDAWNAPEFDSETHHVIYNLQKVKQRINKKESAKKSSLSEKKGGLAPNSEVKAPGDEKLDNSEDSLISSQDELVEDGDEVEESVEDVDDNELKIPSAQELEELRRSVELDAYQKGFEKGEAHGLESGKKQIDDQYQPDIEKSCNALKTLTENLSQSLSQQEDAILQTLLNTVVTLVTNITRKELSIPNAALTDLIEESLQIIGDSKQAKTILVNPGDLTFITERSEHKSWNLIADEKITAGGCRIITEDSSVDSTVETRVNDTIEKFLNKEFASH